MQIFSTRICFDCEKKFDWTGTYNNIVSEDLRNQIRMNKNLKFARVVPILGSEYQVETRCSHCGTHNKFSYILNYNHL
jgi:hypothetical protein